MIKFIFFCLFKDSRGSLHRIGGPTSSITAATGYSQLETSEPPIYQQKSYLPIADIAALENRYAVSASNRNSLFSDTHSNAGSLFSIHSAPPTGMLTTGPNALGDEIGVGTESPRRPVSLAIDSFKPLHHSLLHQTSEIEEEDNENLLTVSSLTARPLIAKSRELRSNRFVFYLNNCL